MSLAQQWGMTIKASSPRTVIVVVDGGSASLQFRYGMVGDSPTKFVRGIQARLDGIQKVVGILDKSIDWKASDEPYVHIDGGNLVMDVERKYLTKAWGEELSERVEVIRALCHRAGWKVVIG